MDGQHVEAGDGVVVVQIQGDGNAVNVNQPHLELTRRTGLSRRIDNDPETGKPIKTDLIRPFARAIELVGREVELDSLRSWLKSEPPISVQVLTGESGLGKTRLALELAEEAATSGWRAGFITRQELTRFVGQTNLAAWGWNAPVLAIVDYASASASDLNTWFLRLVDHRIWDAPRTGSVRPLRVLLLERHATIGVGWWAETFRSGDTASPELMLNPRQPVALSRIGEPKQRREILERTLARLGSDLKLPADVEFERRLAKLTWGGVPLLLMVAAVTADRDGFGAALALSSDKLALNIAEKELLRIRNVATGNRVDRVLATLVNHLVAVATLRQGISREAVHGVIKTEAAALGYELPYGPEPLREALATALPTSNGDVAAVEPDMIGEALLLVAWQNGRRARDPVVAEDVVLSAIRRAHRADPTAVMETVIRTCQDYVIHGYREPLGWLELVFEERKRVGGKELMELANAMPESTVELRELALKISQSATKLIGRLARESSDDVHIRRAYSQSLDTLSNRLSEVGCRDAALAYAQEAADLRRELAAERPDAFRPNLAASLNTLSNSLSEVGRREDALDAAREAADLYRELAAERPDAFRPDLAGSLNNLSNSLSEVGRREDALAAAREAADLRRELAAERPDAFRPDLAMSLNNLSLHLSGVGRREDALAAAREAADLRRELAAERPDAFRPDLAMSLNNLSLHLSGVGRREDALAAAREAADLYRELAAERPDAFRPDLAGSLNNLSNSLSEVGRREDALAAAREAADLCRELAAERPDAFRPDLAGSLNTLSNSLSEVGRREDALAAAREAADLCRELAAERPDAFRPDLAGFLNTLSNSLSEVGRREDALAAAREAADLCRELAAERPDAFRPDLAGFLNTLSNRLSEVGRREDALAAAQEAADLYRELAAERPDAFRPDLAGSLNNLSNSLSEVGRREDALDMIENAARTLSEPFFSAPAAVASRMSQIVRSYLERCAEADREPNPSLVAPIVETLRRLNSDRSGQDE